MVRHATYKKLYAPLIILVAQLPTAWAVDTIINSSVTQQTIASTNDTLTVVSGGDITHAGDALVFSAGVQAATITVNDGGQIVATGAGNSAIDGTTNVGGGTGTITVTNFGTINGVDAGLDFSGVSVGESVLSFTNSLGSVTGVIRGTPNNDTFTVSGGSIQTGIEAGAGTNTLIFSGGVVNGNVTTGAGTQNTLTLSGATVGNDINFTASTNDTITHTAGTVSGSISLGSGSTYTLNGGTLSTNLTLTGGTSTVNLDSGTLTGNLAGGAGGNNITMKAGSIAGASGISAGTAGDTVVIEGGSVTQFNASNNNDSLTLSGGSITTINGGTTGGTNTFNFSGGSITTFNGSDTGCTDNITLSGTTITTMTLTGNATTNFTISGGSVGSGITFRDNDTIALNGGSITGAVSGGGVNTHISVNGTFTTANTYGTFGNLTVNSGGNFSVGHNTTPSGSITVNSGGSLTFTAGTNSAGTTLANHGSLAVSGGSLTANNSITNTGSLGVNGGSLTSTTGALTNTGTVSLGGGTVDTNTGFSNTTGTVTVPANSNVTGDYTTAGTHTVHIINGTPTVLAVTGNIDIQGSIAVVLEGSTYIADGQALGNIITSGGVTTHSPTLSDNSISLDFTSNQVVNDITLSATRVPYANLVTESVASKIATILDGITPSNNSDLANLFRALDSATSVQALQAGINQLTPDINGDASALSSHDIQTATLSLVENRVNGIAHNQRLTAPAAFTLFDAPPPLLPCNLLGPS